jgi:hypothetical protein
MTNHETSTRFLHFHASLWEVLPKSTNDCEPKTYANPIALFPQKIKKGKRLPDPVPMHNKPLRALQLEFSEALTFLTQLPRAEFPILPLNAAIAVFPRPIRTRGRCTTGPLPSGNFTMSMIRPIAWLAALIAALAVAGSASAQFQPPLTSPGSDHFWEFQPFIDPGYFQHDFQFFAPPEVSDFGGEWKPNTGFYVTFDRTDMLVSRPIDRFSFGSQTKADNAWGNRMELGYMKGDPSGWQGVFWHVNGPNERIANASVNEVFQNFDTTNPIQNQFVAPQAFDSLNQLKMTSFELNKVWRLKPYHNGTVLEPLVGYRYFNVRDYYQRDTLLEVPFPPRPTTDEMFINTIHNAQFINSMHGGQIGARLSRQRGHWLLSSEVRVFGCANFQLLRIRNIQSALPNPELALTQGQFDDFINFFGTGGDVNVQTHYYHATQFCWGGEVRADASYELTRDINLRVGFTFLDLGQGIGRGDLLRLNNQAIQMAGVTFGFTVNR